MTNKTNNKNTAIESALTNIADAKIRQAVAKLATGKASTVFISQNEAKTVNVFASYQLLSNESGIGMLDKQGVPVFGQASLSDTLLVRISLKAVGKGKDLHKSDLYATANLGNYIVPVSFKADKTKQRGFVPVSFGDARFSHTASKGFETLTETTLSIKFGGIDLPDLEALLHGPKATHALSQECNDMTETVQGKTTLYGMYQEQQRAKRALRNKK